MSALTGVSATSAVGSVTPAVTVALTGVSASATVGVIATTHGPGESFDLLYPTLQLQLTGVAGVIAELAIEHALPVLAMTGSVPVPATLVLRAPRDALVLAGVSGAVGELTIVAPTLAIQFGSGAGLNLQLPLPTLVLQGRQGAIGQLALAAPRTALAMQGRSDFAGELALAPHAATLAMQGLSGAAGRFAAALPAPTLVLTGVVGARGAMTIEVPAPQLQLAGILVATGVMALASPTLALVMRGVTTGTTAQVAVTRTTYALQTERAALTRYTNYPFNSFAVFAGRNLGASSAGIFELVGDSDAGVAIAAAARFGITDLGTSMLKRVNSVYVGCRVARGKRALLLRVTTNETQQRDYGVKPSISDGLHTTRVDLGAGVESRYWQFELRNRDGIDFSVDTVDVARAPLHRRLGAKDA